MWTGRLTNYLWPCSNFNYCSTPSSGWQRQWVKHLVFTCTIVVSLLNHLWLNTNTLQAKDHYVGVYKAKGHCSYVNCELPVAKFQFLVLAVPYTRKLGGGSNLTILWFCPWSKSPPIFDSQLSWLKHIHSSGNTVTVQVPCRGMMDLYHTWLGLLHFHRKEI